jgi:hypothetical protein
MEQLDLKSFYNTTHECGHVLKEYEEKAGHQEKEVIAIFKKYPAKTELTPDEVHGEMIEGSDNNVPITSTRRAMTNLTKARILEKTSNKKLGGFGRLTYCWKLKGE